MSTILLYDPSLPRATIEIVPPKKTTDTDSAPYVVEEPDLIAEFFKSLNENPDKRRRYNEGWLNIVAANVRRSDDKKCEEVLAEIARASELRKHSPQAAPCSSSDSESESESPDEIQARRNTGEV